MNRIRLAVMSVLVLLLIGSALNGALTVKQKSNWVALGGMTSTRSGACSVLLGEGRVLVTGGLNETGVLWIAEVLSLNGDSTPSAPSRASRPR